MALARVVLWGLLLVGLVAISLPAAEVDRPAEEEFVDVLGNRFRLPRPDDCKAIVLIFVGHDCPISNGYSPEIVRICQDFQPKKVAFCVVYADADLGYEAARKHAREYGYCCPALLDPQLTLARWVGATVKPECALLSPRGERLYRGRIDDRYLDFGKRREQVTRKDLRDALVAVLAGKTVANPRTPTIGCDIDFPANPK